MKRFLVVCCLACLNFIAKSQTKVDVQHYDFQILLTDASDSIKGTTTMRVLFLQETNQLQLDLKNIDSKKGMAVLKVSDSLNQLKPLLFQHKADKLTISFENKIKQGTVKTIVIKYQGIPSDGLIISKNKFGHRTFFSDNWPNRAHNWLPCVDDPADKASVTFTVTAPSYYQVISNGIQVEETNLPGNLKLTSYKEEIPLPTKIMVIGVAEFAVSHTGRVNECIPVSTWVFPQNKDNGFADYNMIPGILDFYIKYIGPYAYKKLANVQSKTIFGGMENASAIFYFENSVDGNHDHETLFAHEIVHQWFGNMATEKSFAHLWLSEGFATYLTHVYIESKYGTDSLEKRLQNERQDILDFVKRSHRPVVDTTSNYMSLLNENSYQKGGWVLHMLRRQLGDSIFHEGIRSYYKTYAGKNADTKDLQNIFEQVSGKNLANFFNQWLYRGENPSIEVSWNYDTQKKMVNLKIRQLQQAVFEAPIKIGFVSKSGVNKTIEYNMNSAENKFSFALSEKPTKIIADPNTSLLAQIVVIEK